MDEYIQHDTSFNDSADLRITMNKKVLIVDDDLAILEVIKIILEDEGYEVFTLTDGDTIISTIRQIHPHLILLDYWIPAKKNGGEIARELKSNSQTAGIPIIMISANHNIETSVDKMGIDIFLPKPFNIDDLVSLVAKHSL